MTSFQLKIALWSILVLALIIGVLNWNKFKKTSQRYFLYLIAVVLFSEGLATYMKEVLNYSNYPIYNILSLLLFLFYFYWFNLILKTKKWFKPVTVIFTVSILISLFTESFFNGIWKVMWSIGAVLVLFCVYLYYSELLHKPLVIKFQKMPEFWIVTGVLMYHIGFLPLLLFMTFFDSNTYYYRIPILILNIILYSCFIKSFLCFKSRKI